MSLAVNASMTVRAWARVKWKRSHGFRTPGPTRSQERVPRVGRDRRTAVRGRHGVASRASHCPGRAWRIADAAEIVGVEVGTPALTMTNLYWDQHGEVIEYAVDILAPGRELTAEYEVA